MEYDALFPTFVVELSIAFIFAPFVPVLFPLAFLSIFNNGLVALYHVRSGILEADMCVMCCHRMHVRIYVNACNHTDSLIFPHAQDSSTFLSTLSFLFGTFM